MPQPDPVRRDGREHLVAGFRASLLPVHLELRSQPWLGGAAPSYADHIVADTLMRPRRTSTFRLLDPEGPVAARHARVLNLYGGLLRGAMTA